MTEGESQEPSAETLERARKITEGWTGIEMLSADGSRRIVMVGSVVDDVTVRVAYEIREAVQDERERLHAMLEMADSVIDPELAPDISRRIIAELVDCATCREAPAVLRIRLDAPPVLGA